MDPRYRVGREQGGCQGVKIFFVTYFEKVLPISQIAVPKKLESSDVQKRPNLCVYDLKLQLKAKKKSTNFFKIH